MSEPKNTDEYEAKRSEILEGASSVFASSGFAKGTTRQIANIVGLGQPTIYHYVGSKRELLEHLYLQISHDMKEILENCLHVSDDPGTNLTCIVHEFVEVVAKKPKSFTVFYQELRSISLELRKRVEQDERNFVHAVAELVEKLQEGGRLPAGPPTVVAEAILSMPIWMYHWYNPDGKLKPDEIARVICSLIQLT